MSVFIADLFDNAGQKVDMGYDAVCRAALFSRQATSTRNLLSAPRVAPWRGVRPTQPIPLSSPGRGFSLRCSRMRHPSSARMGQKRGPEEPIANLTERFKGQLSAPGHDEIGIPHAAFDAAQEKRANARKFPARECYPFQRGRSFRMTVRGSPKLDPRNDPAATKH